MSIQFKTLLAIEECKEVWKDIVVPQSLYEEWEMRVCFYNPKYPLKFIAVFNNNDLVGLLPLQYNTNKDYLEFFGGRFTENNRIYFKSGYEYIIQNLIQSINQRVRLFRMKSENDYIRSLPFDDNLYDLDISNYNSLDDFLEINLPGRTRQNLRRTIRKFETIELSIEFNRFQDLDRLIELNRLNFSEESMFNDINIYEGFHKIINKFDSHMISILIDGNPTSIAFCINYQNIYYSLTSGTNKESISGLGSYLLLNTMKYAIENKFEIYDAGVNDCNWKESWHLTPHPLYKYQNFEV